MKKSTLLFVILFSLLFTVSCGQTNNDDKKPEDTNASISDAEPSNTEPLYINESIHDTEYLTNRDWYNCAYVHEDSKVMVHASSEWYNEEGVFTIPFDVNSFEELGSSYKIFAETTIPLEILDNVSSEELLCVLKECLKSFVYSRYFYESDAQYYDMFTAKCQAADVLQYRTDARAILEEDYQNNVYTYKNENRIYGYNDINVDLSDASEKRKYELLSILAYERIALGYYDNAEPFYIDGVICDVLYLEGYDWYNSVTMYSKDKVHASSEWLKDGVLTIPFAVSDYNLSGDMFDIMAQTSIPFDIIDDISTEDLLDVLRECVKLPMYNLYYYESEGQYFDILRLRCQVANVIELRNDTRSILEEDYQNNLIIYENESQLYGYDELNADLSDECTKRKYELLSILTYEGILLGY